MNDKNYQQNSDKFYRGIVFDMIDERLKSIEIKIDSYIKQDLQANENLERKLDYMIGKIKYILGFTAGVSLIISFIISFIINWLKNRII